MLRGLLSCVANSNTPPSSTISNLRGTCGRCASLPRPPKRITLLSLYNTIVWPRRSPNPSRAQSSRHSSLGNEVKFHCCQQLIGRIIVARQIATKWAMIISNRRKIVSKETLLVSEGTNSNAPRSTAENKELNVSSRDEIEWSYSAIDYQRLAWGRSLGKSEPRCGERGARPSQPSTSAKKRSSSL